MEKKRKKLTEEELKAKKKARDTAYRKATKEKFAIKRKVYHETYDKKYRNKNKEAIAIKRKIHYETNKEAYAIRDKAHYKTQRLTHYIVYCLPYYDKNGYMAYVGVTNIPSNRMKNHKTNGNNIDEWFILQVCETRKEAEEVEAEYHKKGYDGKKGYKNR